WPSQPQEPARRSQGTRLRPRWPRLQPPGLAPLASIDLRCQVPPSHAHTTDTKPRCTSPNCNVSTTIRSEYDHVLRYRRPLPGCSSLLAWFVDVVDHCDD